MPADDTTPVARVLAALRAHGLDPKPSGDGHACRCPTHDDRTPSLSIGQGEDERALLHCHRGCPTEGIASAIGLTMADLMPPRVDGLPRKSHPDAPRQASKSACQRKPKSYDTPDAAIAVLESKHGEPAARWTYTDASGEPRLIVVRFAEFHNEDGEKPRKTFRPIGKTSEGWIIGDPPAPLPLYGLLGLLATQPGDRIYVVEGERCADVARSLGLVATSSAHGSDGAKKSDWTPLRDRHVVILPDNDSPGDDYAAEVIQLAHAAGATSACIVRLPDLPQHGDIADYVDAMDSRDSEDIRVGIEAMADAAQPIMPSALDSNAPTTSSPSTYTRASDLLNRWIDDVRHGEPPVLWGHGFDALDLEIGPERVLLVGGAPGAGKTALVMQIVIEILLRHPDVRALVANVEMSPARLLDRQLARLSPMDLTRLMRRELSDRERTRIEGGIDQLRTIADRLCFLSGPYTLAAVTDACHDIGANLVVCDYIQRFGLGAEGHPSDRRSQVEAIMSGMRDLAMEGRGVIVVSAVARSRGQRGASNYDDLTLASFRDSSELEYAADDAFLMVSGDAQPNAVVLKHVKARYGECRDRVLEFDRPHQSFRVTDLTLAELST